MESNGSDGVSVSSVTWNGVGLSLHIAQSAGGGWGRAEIWKLVNPDTGTHDLVVNLNTGDRFFTAAIFAENVDQTTPLLTGAEDHGNGAAPSCTVGSVGASDLVFDVVSIDGGGKTPSPGANQTGQWDINSGGENEGAGSTQSGADGGVMSWSWSGSSDYALVAAAFKDAGGGGGGSYLTQLAALGVG